MKEAEAEELRRTLEFLWREVDKCEEGGAYLAGAVMVGACLEAALLGMVDVFEERVKERLLGKEEEGGKRWGWGGRGKRWDPGELSLNALLRVAFEMEWLEYRGAEEPEEGALGDWLLNVVREVRNWVHPGKKIREYPDIAPTKELLETCRNLVGDAQEELLSELYKSISADLEQDLGGGAEEGRNEC